MNAFCVFFKTFSNLFLFFWSDAPRRCTNARTSSFNFTKRNLQIVLTAYEKNQTFLASIRLKKAVSKIQSARAFYEQRNVPNPFKFDYTESTILGYQLGIALGQGLVLNYTFRRSFRDMNGDGKISGDNETIDIRSIETSFSF